jgi:Tfp pilus assembly pilus retraction ATPase PilT
VKDDQLWVAQGLLAAPLDADGIMAKLGELDFTDLYIRLDESDVSRYSPTPRRGSTLPKNMLVPPEYDKEIDILVALIRKEQHDDFALDLEDMRMRGSRCTLFGDQKWVALRRLPLNPPLLEDLHFRSDILAEFRSWGPRSGLVLVGGATRAGKTTTLVALLCEMLRSHGGVAYSIEDPVEFYLQGEHGAGGYCFQREVHRDEEWGEAVKTALRWAPRFIFLGEVRTPAAAKWLLRAATSGHMVLCTVHGGSIEETLSAILQVAQSELGETAATILGDGLCAVVHQKITNGRPEVQILTTGLEASDPVRVLIRSKKLQQLGTEISKQNTTRQMAMEENGGTTTTGSSGSGGSSGASTGGTRAGAAVPSQVGAPARPRNEAKAPPTSFGGVSPKQPVAPVQSTAQPQSPKKKWGVF